MGWFLTLMLVPSVVFAATPRAVARLDSVALPGLGQPSDIAAGAACVFVGSTGGADEPLIVVDRSTMQVATTIPAREVDGLLVRGDALYVVAGSSATVDRYTFDDACATTELTSYELPDQIVTPMDIAWADGALQVVGSGEGGVLVRLDPGSGDTSVSTNERYGMELATSSSQPELLLMGPTLTTVDVSADPPAVQHLLGVPYTGDGPFAMADHDAAVFKALSCSGAGLGIQEFTSELVPGVCHDTHPERAVGVAPHPSVERLTALTYSQYAPLHLRVWSTATGEELVNVEAPIPGALDEGSLRYAPDGGAMYVTSKSKGEPRRLYELPGDVEDAELSITAPKLLTFPERFTVTVHLEGEGVTNGDVRLYGTRSTGKRVLLDAGPVDGEGNFVYSARAERDLTLEAEWDGDESHLPITTTHELLVRALVKGVLKDHVAMRDGFHVYRAGGVPRYEVAVKPVFVHERVKLSLQRMHASKWRFVGTDSFRLNADGRLRIFIVGARVGTKYRIVTQYDGANNAPSRSLWGYFTLVRAEGRTIASASLTSPAISRAPLPAIHVTRVSRGR